MAYSSNQRRTSALAQKRGPHGYFLPKVTISNTAGKQKEQVSPQDDTIVDVKIKNPLHRITEILKEIKAHQATTVSLRFTIPLIALPIVMLVAFQLGRAQTACTQIFTAKTGTIKIRSVLVSKEEQNPFSLLFSFFPAMPKLKEQATLAREIKTMLLTAQNEVITIVHEPSISLAAYNNQLVFINGDYSACTHVITLDAIENISPLSQ